MTYIRAIAFDPGKITGVAIMAQEAGQKPTFLTTQVDTHPWSFLLYPDPTFVRNWTHVVCESFASAGRVSGDGLQTLRWIGGIQALALAYRIPCQMQTPFKRMAFLEDAWTIIQEDAPELKPSKTKYDHQISALAHLLAWHDDYIKEKKRDELAPSLR